MTTAREHARALRRHARTWFAPPGAPATPDPDLRATTPDPATVIAWATRDLLRAESSEDVARIVANTIDVLGGWVVPATTDDPSALPLDVSFGMSEPMLPTAPPDSPALDALTRHLPGFVADARQANDVIVRTAHLATDVATDPVTGLQTRATFTRELGRLREEDAVVVLRVTVPEPDEPEADDGLEDAVRAFASYLQAQRGPSDHAARLEEDEFGLLLRQTGIAGTTVAVERLRRSWRAAHPDTGLHLGVAHFRDSGTATLRDAYDALDQALDAEPGEAAPESEPTSERVSEPTVERVSEPTVERESEPAVEPTSP
jgi:GGDEF domain-containing protein